MNDSLFGFVAKLDVIKLDRCISQINSALALFCVWFHFFRIQELENTFGRRDCGLDQ